MTHYALAASRVAHRADLAHVELADKLGAERRSTRRVESVQDVEVFLHQFCTRQGAEIVHAVVYGVDAVCTDGDHDVTVTGKDLRNVVVSLKAGDR